MIFFAIIFGDDVGCVGVDDIITAKNSVTFYRNNTNNEHCPCKASSEP